MTTINRLNPDELAFLARALESKTPPTQAPASEENGDASRTRSVEQVGPRHWLMRTSQGRWAVLEHVHTAPERAAAEAFCAGHRPARAKDGRRPDPAPVISHSMSAKLIALMLKVHPKYPDGIMARELAAELGIHYTEACKAIRWMARSGYGEWVHRGHRSPRIFRPDLEKLATAARNDGST